MEFPVTLTQLSAEQDHVLRVLVQQIMVRGSLQQIITEQDRVTVVAMASEQFEVAPVQEALSTTVVIHQEVQVLTMVQVHT